MNRPDHELHDAGDAAALASMLDHEQLETVYGALLRAHQNDDWDSVHAEWERFESAICHHLAREEDGIFPLFMAVEPEEATALLAEHSALRHLVSGLRVAIADHAVRLHMIQDLLASLRSHADRENRILYPWASKAV